MSPSSSPVEFSLNLNGTEVTVKCDPADRLLDVLRYRLGLPGTKDGCAESPLKKKSGDPKIAAGCPKFEGR